MGRQSIEIIKDLIISILIVIVLGLILSVIFYDKVSLSKVIPVSEDYELTEQMEEELKNTNLDEAEEVIVNYYIDATDLKKYEKNNEYVKGKSNPFAVDSSYDENTISGNNSSSTGNNNSGFYEDDGTK